MLPDLTGKTAIVTGANNGIGKDTALELARNGASVIIASRDPTKGTKAAADIAETVGAKDGQVKYMHLDLASLKSVQEFARAWMKTDDHINMLILNAGVMKSYVADAGALWYNQTEDGFEEMIGVNHVAHYLLTRLLEPRLKASAPARVVSVASMAEWFSYPEGMRYDAWRSKANYDDGRSYGMSKLANIMFIAELAERLQGSGVTAYSVHPGIIGTGLQKYVNTWFSSFTGMTKLSTDWAMFVGNSAFLDTAGGALTSLYAAGSSDVDDHPEYNGKYFWPAVTPMTPVHPAAQDVAKRKELWQKTEEAVKPFMSL